MTRPLTVAILLISTAPLYAQGQQLNVAKLKADAQKVVSVISGDKAKTQAYCQIAKISVQVDQAAQEKDRKKAEELVQKINELEKQLGPEYLALVDALFNNNNVDLNSEDFEEIVSAAGVVCVLRCKTKARSISGQLALAYFRRYVEPNQCFKPII